MLTFDDASNSGSPASHLTLQMRSMPTHNGGFAAVFTLFEETT
ncbi:hypothetical protein [Variovorax sp. dw_954]|nr:hypothetical protein [Variovorax sp. dw_954]